MTNEQLTEQQREVFGLPLPLHLRRLADQMELVAKMMQEHRHHVTRVYGEELEFDAKRAREWANEAEEIEREEV